MDQTLPQRNAGVALFLVVDAVGTVLFNQFIVQTKDQNCGCPLSDEQRFMMSIDHF